MEKLLNNRDSHKSNKSNRSNKSVELDEPPEEDADVVDNVKAFLKARKLDHKDSDDNQDQADTTDSRTPRKLTTPRRGVGLSFKPKVDKFSKKTMPKFKSDSEGGGVPALDSDLEVTEIGQ